MMNLCDDVHAPFATSVTTACLSLLLCCITVPGNILICIAILKDPYQELSNSFNYFVLQLAFSDVIVGIFTEPAFVVWHIREALGHGVSGTIWIVHLTFFISCTASLLSLTALTLDRHLTIVTIRRKFSTRSVVLICALIWFYISDDTSRLFRYWVLLVCVYIRKYRSYHHICDCHIFLLSDSLQAKSSGVSLAFILSRPHRVKSHGHGKTTYAVI